MQDASAADYYEALQISPNADTDMVSRVYRLLAQRFHPDNRETGDSERFRRVHEAYSVLSDPERRAQYDVHYQRQRHLRVKLVSSTGHVDTDFEYEQAVRLTVLEILDTHRRTDSREPGLFDRELESMVGRPLEQLEFTLLVLDAAQSDSAGRAVTYRHHGGGRRLPRAALPPPREEAAARAHQGRLASPGGNASAALRRRCDVSRHHPTRCETRSARGRRNRARSYVPARGVRFISYSFGGSAPSRCLTK